MTSPCIQKSAPSYFYLVSWKAGWLRNKHNPQTQKERLTNTGCTGETFLLETTKMLTIWRLIEMVADTSCKYFSKRQEVLKFKCYKFNWGAKDKEANCRWVIKVSDISEVENISNVFSWDSDRRQRIVLWNILLDIPDAMRTSWVPCRWGRVVGNEAGVHLQINTDMRCQRNRWLCWLI